MRVLFVIPGSTDAASARYRCGHLAQALALRGHHADCVSATESAAIGIRHDVVVLHRIGWSGAGQRLVNAARRAGAAVVYGADDLIFEPEYAYQMGLAHPDDPTRYHFHRREGDETLRCLLQTDAVLVSTEFLAARARHAFACENVTEKPVRVLRNFVSREILSLSSEARERRGIGFPPASPEGDAVVLGYLSGSPTHDADLAALAPVLASVFERHAAARLLVVGPVALPPVLQPAAASGRISRHPFVPWRDLPALLSGIDINLAPLDTTRVFNHAKSEVKFLEAGAVFRPTIASAAVGFAEGVRDGHDCVLVHNATDWLTALEPLLTDRVLGEEIGAQARAGVEARATTDAVADDVAAVFEAFAGLSRTAPKREAFVRQPLAEQLERGFRRAEESTLRRLFRLARHIRLLGSEQP